MLYSDYKYYNVKITFLNKFNILCYKLKFTLKVYTVYTI